MYMYDLIDVKEYTDSEFDQARNLRIVHGTRPRSEDPGVRARATTH